MLRKIFISIIMIMALSSFIGSYIHAQAPATIVYQGKLTNADGEPITSASVTFYIYADEEGGSSLWSENHSITADDNGVFTIELGTTSSLSTSIFNGDARYLAIKVGSDAEMTPRQLITSVPYAYSAENIPDGSVTKAKLNTEVTDMMPIAMAYVSSNGTVYTGTSNVSSTWNATDSRYEITITGENYVSSNYVTIVTPPYDNKTVGTASVNGKLLVYIYNSSNTLTQSTFQFVTYKP